LDRSRLEMEGLVTTASANLDRPAGYGAWSRPAEVAAHDSRLVYGAFDDASAVIADVRSGAKMLEDFVRLSDAEDAVIESYAQTWGVLGLCAKHRLPQTHYPQRLWQWVDEDEFRPCRPAGGLKRSASRHEPLAGWREFASQGSAMLNIAAALAPKLPEPVPPEAWRVLDPLVPMSIEAAVTPSDVDGLKQRRLLEMAVQSWLTLGDVSVSFSWRMHRPVIDIGSGSLFGALALQLALAVARVDGLDICDNCGRFFIPKRRNPAGTPRRCPDTECRSRMPKRKYAAERRAKEAAERA
jgi:hypothetical protein